MRLKTKLVLAITALVFLIAGLVSLVYVQPVGESGGAADLRHQPHGGRAGAVCAAECAGDRPQGPHGRSQQSRASCARWWPKRCATTRIAGGAGSVNRYSLTVYDVNIGDSQGVTLLSTNPDNQGKPLPVAPQL